MTYSFRTNGNFIDFVHTDNTSLQVENLLKSLHNTSRSVSWSLPEDITRISFILNGDEYNNLPITEIDFDGVAMDSQDDFETGIVAMFPGLEGSGGSPVALYLVYTAVLNQSGTSAPSATVLENTIGTVSSYDYNNVGSYQIVFATPNVLGANPVILLGTCGTLGFAYRIAGDIVGIVTKDDFSTPGNDNLSNTAIEIRVYL